MKPTINYRQTACRLLAGLFFFLLLAPIAAGEEVSPPPTYWKDQISKVDRLANKDGGDGKKGNPILIATAKELAYFAQQVNSKLPITYGSGTDQIEPNGKDQDAGGFKDYYFALSANINLEKHYWTPIGTEDNPFKGYFDGKGHYVSGLKVNVNEKSDPAYAGLFGNAFNGTIQNLGVRLAQEGVRATSTNTKSINLYAGGIAGSALHVYNCYVVGEGSIEINSEGEGFGYAGGIVGYITTDGSITNCYATVDIRIENSGIRYAGGIVGFCSSNSTISYTYATGDVEIGTGGNLYYAGGICGYLNTRSKIENSLALNGRITGGDSNSNRIVGSTGTTTLTTNYASPDIVVNDKTVSGGTDGDANGDPNVNLDNFDKVFSWDEGWDTSDNTRLPKLNIRTGDGPDYAKWPTGEDFAPQSPPDATRYLQATQIANASNGDGSGWNKAIQIANRAELAYLAKQVNAKGNLTVAKGVDGGSIENKTGDDSGFKGIYFALANDIDLKDHYWKPIGTGSNPFKGNFDGKGHCVNGLKVKVIENKVKGAYAGLFGNANVGTIQNVGVCLAKEGVRATITNTGGGNLHAGVIAGYALNVHNCYVVGEGSIEINGGSSGYAGGIVGYLISNGSLTNCYATVDITIENSVERYAGGIIGFCNYNSTISCTYATGDVETGTGANRFYAGGICGYLGSTSTIQNSLALNGRITGSNSLSNRIVGKKYSNASLTTNYASPEIVVNGKTFPDTDNLIDNENGANTLLSSFEADLKKEPAGDANGWVTSWTFTSGYLPQLKKKISDDKYGEWGNEQPQLNASRYLPPRLYIIEPLTGGTLTVTDDAGKPLTDGSTVISGTVLTLAKTLESGYVFDAYLVSSDGSNFTDHIDGTIVMPDHDLYLSARFKEEQKPEPEPPYIPPTPIYYSVYLPQVEGATTDPGPGEHEVESWDNFRFYLTIDSAYSESQPVVTTDRGETLVPRTSDGAYLVKYVRTDVEVFIDGLVQNPPPVANEAIGTDALVPQIWAEGTMLCIRMADALPSAPVRIFTVDGRLYDSFASTPGLNRRQLPTGIYIVRVGETVRKVVVPKT